MAIRHRAAETASSVECDIRPKDTLTWLGNAYGARPVGRAPYERFRRSAYLSGRSSGAPVPDEPTNNFLPSGNVMSRPLARFAPSLAWKPSTRISVPSVSDFLFQPRRSNAFGEPPSTIQRSTLPVCGSFTSMLIQYFGLIYSIFTTVPRSLTGRFASNSAANEWCADTWTAVTDTRSAAPATTLTSFVRIGFISIQVFRTFLNSTSSSAEAATPR